MARKRRNLSSRLKRWWRRRNKERKRLKLLALVRKVREEQGDYDRGTFARRSVQRQAQSSRVRDNGGKVRKAVPATVRKSNEPNS